MPSISEQLRAAIRASGHTAVDVSRATGIPQPTISRFLAGTDLRISNVDKIAEFLGLELTAKKSSRPKKKPAK